MQTIGLANHRFRNTRLWAACSFLGSHTGHLSRKEFRVGSVNPTPEHLRLTLKENFKFLLFHWETKGRFRKRVVLANVPSFRCAFGGNTRPHPRSGFPSGGACECTLVPVFVPEEHLPKPPFWKTTLLSIPDCFGGEEREEESEVKRGGGGLYVWKERRGGGPEEGRWGGAHRAVLVILLLVLTSIPIKKTCGRYFCSLTTIPYAYAHTGGCSEGT